MIRFALALAAGLAVPTAAMAVTPIHAYEFDAGVTDSVGGADGTLLGGASVSGGRLILDGINDYVDFATRLVPTSGAYSVFIRVDGTPNLGRFTEIISQGFSGGPGFYIGTAPGGGIRLTDVHTSTGVAFPTGEAELLFTSGASGARLFINGTSVFSSGTPGAGGFGGSTTRFGRQFGGIEEYFAGSIDAIRIYNSVILPTDVIEPGVVPEPASWAMLIAGFGLTGAAMRRRRRDIVPA